jgi:hypothetical protein
MEDNLGDELNSTKNEKKKSKRGLEYEITAVFHVLLSHRVVY